MMEEIRLYDINSIEFNDIVELYNRLLGIDKTLSKNSCGSSRKKSRILRS